jgi:hypothetical protein
MQEIISFLGKKFCMGFIHRPIPGYSQVTSAVLDRNGTCDGFLEYLILPKHSNFSTTLALLKDMGTLFIKTRSQFLKGPSMLP